jgi:acetyl-CoA synthetase
MASDYSYYLEIISVIKTLIFLSFQEILFTGDGALETRLYRITGRVDDVVIVSGHNLGTAQLRTL